MEIVWSDDVVGGYGAMGYGSGYPMPSPDGKWIVNAQGGEIWLYDVEAQSESQISHINEDCESRECTCGIYLTTWRPDSRVFLYALRPVSLAPSKGSNCAGVGFYSYELSSGAHNRMPIEGGVYTWLPSGDIVISTGRYLSGDVALLSLADSAIIHVIPGAGDLRSLGSDPHGKRLIGRLNLSQPACSRIVMIDLDDYSTTFLTDPGLWTQYHSASFSPTGSRIAYIEEPSRGPDSSTRRLIIDSKVMLEWTARRRDHYRYTWIDDAHIALVNPESLLVMDAVTGDIRGRRAIGKQGAGNHRE